MNANKPDRGGPAAEQPDGLRAEDKYKNLRKKCEQKVDDK